MTTAQTGMIGRYNPGRRAEDEVRAAAETAAADRLAPYLDPGESLVWSGRPMLRPVLEGHDLILPALTLVLGVALFQVLDPLGPAGLPAEPTGLFFLVIMLVLFGCSVWLPLRTFLRRRRSFYGVTERRALVLECGPGGSFHAYPLEWDRIVNIRFGERVSVIFEPSQAGGHGQERGFEQLIDGLKVYRLIRRIQTSARFQPEGGIDTGELSPAT